MKKKIIYFLVLIFLVILAFFVYQRYGSQNTQIIDTKGNDETIQNQPTEQNSVIEPKIYYPISKYQERLTYRKFGQVVTPSDKPVCGRSFSGFHDADDLEILPGEENFDVPVFAVNDGKVVLLSYIDGYGGLLMLQTNLNGQDVILNYGHINLGSAKVKLNDSVNAGQELASLGRGCSAETDGERKHLHFAIHKGTTINVLGYLPSENDLNQWINPHELLKQLGAVEK